MRNTILIWVRRIGEYLQLSSGRYLDGYVASLDNKIIASGMLHTGFSGVDFLGFQLLSMVFFPLFWILVLSQISFFDFLFAGPQQLLFYLLLIVFGVSFPLLPVQERIKKRQEQIILSLPDAMDLLTITVEAGLDFMSALNRVVEKQKEGPLRDELQAFFNEMELGRPRIKALRELARRIQLRDFQKVVSALIQSDRLGSSLGPTLKAQSDMLRIRRGQRAEKKAQEAPVKMLAPLLMCIFPAVFITIFAPVLIQMLQNLKN